MTDTQLAKLLGRVLQTTLATIGATACGGAATEPTWVDAAPAPLDAAADSSACDDASPDACPPALISSCSGPSGAPLAGGMTCLVGRRPHGLTRLPEAPVPSVGDWFAQTARLEAASVLAFGILRAELMGHGAPETLVSQANRAAQDEARHARIAGNLARRFGARPIRPVASRPRVRSLEEIAVENVAEGCVRETFGALVAGWQARTASDPDIARVMHEIAVDETRHAALAWRVRRWTQSRLEASARWEGCDVMETAIRTMRANLCEPPPELRRIAGLPTAANAAAMVTTLHELLWAQDFGRAA